MADQPHTDGLLDLCTLHAGEVVGNLSRTLTEAHHSVVQEGTGVAVGRIGIIESCGQERERKESESLMTRRCVTHEGLMQSPPPTPPCHALEEGKWKARGLGSV